MNSREELFFRQVLALINATDKQTDAKRAMNWAGDRIEQLERQLGGAKWRTVGKLNPTGVEWEVDWGGGPEEGQWILIRNESRSRVWYEVRRHIASSWPSFGVAWKPIEEEQPPPEPPWLPVDEAMPEIPK